MRIQNLREDFPCLLAFRRWYRETYREARAARVNQVISSGAIVSEDMPSARVALRAGATRVGTRSSLQRYPPCGSPCACNPSWLLLLYGPY